MQDYPIVINNIDHKIIPRVKEHYESKHYRFPFEEFLEKLEYGYTFADIGKHYGITRERVRQLYNAHFSILFPTKRKTRTKAVNDLASSPNFEPFIKQFYIEDIDFSLYPTHFGRGHLSRTLMYVNNKVCKLVGNPAVYDKYHRISCSTTTLQKIDFLLIHRKIEGESQFFIIPKDVLESLVNMEVEYHGFYIPLIFSEKGYNKSQIDYKQYLDAWYLLGRIYDN